MSTKVFHVGSHNVVRASYETPKSVSEALKDVVAKFNNLNEKDVIEGVNISYVNVGDDEHVIAIVDVASKEGQDYIQDLLF